MQSLTPSASGWPQLSGLFDYMMNTSSKGVNFVEWQRFDEGFYAIELEGLKTMRTKVLIMLSLLLVAFFATGSYSIDWNNPEYYQSVDDLISSGNG